MNRITATLAAALVLPLALAFPSLPHSFYGNASVNGNPAPADTEITAQVNGVAKGSITTQQRGQYGGSGGYDPKLDVANASSGSSIRFLVNGVPANATASYSSGAVTELNLAWSLPKQLNKSKSPGDVVENDSVTIPSGSNVTYTFGNDARVNLGAGETPTSAQVRNISKVNESTLGNVGVGNEENLNTYEVDVRGDVTVTVTLSYDDAGIDEGTVHPYFHNGTGWERIPNADVVNVDTSANTVTFRIPTARTPYSVFAEPSSGGGGTTFTGGGGGGGGGFVDSYGVGEETEGETAEETGPTETGATPEGTTEGPEETEAPEAPDTTETPGEGEAVEATPPTQDNTAEQGTEGTTETTGPLGAVLGPVGTVASSMWFWISVLVIAGLLTGYLYYKYTRQEQDNSDVSQRRRRQRGKQDEYRRR